MCACVCMNLWNYAYLSLHTLVRDLLQSIRYSRYSPPKTRTYSIFRPVTANPLHAVTAVTARPHAIRVLRRR